MSFIYGPKIEPKHPARMWWPTCPIHGGNLLRTTQTVSKWCKDHHSIHHTQFVYCKDAGWHPAFGRWDSAKQTGERSDAG